MNYAPIVTLGALLLLTIWWHVSAKKWFTRAEPQHRPGRRRGLRGRATDATLPPGPPRHPGGAVLARHRPAGRPDQPQRPGHHDRRRAAAGRGGALLASDAGLLGIDRDAEHVNTARRRGGRGGRRGGRVPARPRRCWSSASCTGGRSRTRTSPTRGAGPGRGRLPAAARRAAVHRRLRHVRPAGGATSRPCGSAASRCRATYDDHADAWADVRRALAAAPRPTVPCNNDLLAANFIDDGERVWLIDYEYSRQQRRLLRARQHLHRVRLHARADRGLDRGVLRRPDAARTWPGCGCRRCAASTAGRCGASSRPPPARSTSTSTAGGWSASRRPRRPSAGPDLAGCCEDVARWLSLPVRAPRSSSSAAA